MTTSIWMRKGAARACMGTLALALCAALAVAPAADAKRITGTNGPDNIVGTNNKDRISARGGDDRVRARGRADVIRGGSGGDKLNGGKGRDNFVGGAGNDLLKAVDGRRDRRVNGGRGNDICRIDQVDLQVVSACETLEAKGQAPPGSLQLTGATGLVCASQLPTCAFQLEGTGAEAPVGLVTGGGGVSLAVGAGVSLSGQDWTAVGLYGCTDDGFLTVTIGSESIDVPITCQTAAP